jgi:hypothetical protein
MIYTTSDGMPSTRIIRLSFLTASSASEGRDLECRGLLRILLNERAVSTAPGDGAAGMLK